MIDRGGTVEVYDTDELIRDAEEFVQVRLAEGQKYTNEHLR